MPVDNEEFRNALGRFASGVSVVTTIDAAGAMHGITVSAFSSVSLDPPLILICIEKTAGSHHAFEESRIFNVNVLSSRQRAMSERFASPNADKFDGIDIEIAENTIPVINGCLAILECSLKEVFDGGDHSIFLGEVERTTVNDGDPLIYFRSGYRKLA